MSDLLRILTVPVLLLAVRPMEIGMRVSGPRYDGIIPSCGTGRLAGCWEPPAAQIAVLEAALEQSVGERHPKGLTGLLHPLTEYKRQYLGYNSKAGTIIMVTGYHKDQEVVKSGRWLKSIITVNGGGGEFFRGRFLVALGSFESLSINAPE